MVSTRVDLREAVGAVADPELRVVTIAELGILRDITEDPASGQVTVTITPTYTGCPAMDVIRADIRSALAGAGHDNVEVVTVLHPPWSTDWINESGRAKLAAAGIAPPARGSAPRIPPQSVVPDSVRHLPVIQARQVALRCPRCGSTDTEQLSRFGSTACKALWRCRACREPFDHLKPL
jgi:ring-1,2-phenylacetyl-CoA epoxidase subunit PaaD